MTAFKFRLEYNSPFAGKLLFSTLFVAAKSHARLVNTERDETGLVLTFDKDVSQTDIINFMSKLESQSLLATKTIPSMRQK